MNDLILGKNLHPPTFIGPIFLCNHIQEVIGPKQEKVIQSIKCIAPPLHEAPTRIQLTSMPKQLLIT